MLNNYFYPKSLDDFKDGDIYEVRLPMTKDNWIGPKVYKNSLCYSKKEEIKYLITNKRIRIEL